MINSHLHILHLFGDTLDDKVNRVASFRYKNLIRELTKQGLSENDYTLVPGFYNPKNTKESINKGHKFIVQSAKELNAPNVIIAEDDIVFYAKGAYKYFLSQIPDDYDLFTALIYNGEVNVDNRILNGMSGTHSLYCVNSRFYDFILSQPDDVHCDRNAGQYAFKYKYYVCPKMCVYQRGGYSYNLKRQMYYDVYLTDKVLFGR